MLHVADLVGGGGGDGAEEVRLHLPRVLERHARDGGLVAARLVVEGGRRLARETAVELGGLPAEQRREPRASASKPTPTPLTLSAPRTTVGYLRTPSCICDGKSLM